MGRKKQNDSVASKALKAGIPKGTVYARLRLGWSMKKALSVPVHNTRPKNVGTSKPINVEVPKKPVPKNNPMFVEKYSSNKPSKLVLWGLAVVAIMFIVKLIGG